jgi:hypothetical protein
MTTSFWYRDIWSQLTKATRRSHNGCDVAVAYFGQGASRLLPLTKGSRLVVDASEHSVACGQTCPSDLMELVKRGVAVYSVPNLHAKVFVLGRTAYIGSANVSRRAASHLVEAVIRTTEPSCVRAARQFVQQHCLHEMTPTLLKRLAKLYHAPLIPGGKPGKPTQAMTAKRPAIPRLLLAQLHLEGWSERDQALHDAGMSVAKKRRKHPRTFELESFRYRGKCPYRCNDVVIQVTDEGGGDVLVTPPGNVLDVRSRRDGNRLVSFVYLERPVRRRRQLKSLVRMVGCTNKRLLHDGIVRDSSLAQALLNTFAVAR